MRRMEWFYARFYLRPDFFLSYPKFLYLIFQHIFINLSFLFTIRHFIGTIRHFFWGYRDHSPIILSRISRRIFFSSRDT